MDTTQPFGLVHGRINLGVGDDTDTGRAPNLVGLNGKAVFTATVDKYLITTPGSEMIIIPSSISADVVNGAVQWLGQDDVPLVANLDATGKSLGWQWVVAFTLNNAALQPVNMIGWRLDVAVYDPNAALVNGVNPTITQLTAQAPVISNSVVTLAKGDPGSTIDLVPGTIVDGSSYAMTITPTSNPLQRALSLVVPNTGAGGTVKKINGLDPDGAGAINLSAAQVGAADATATTTALAQKADATTVNAALGAKADTSALAAGLGGKLDTSASNTLLPRVAGVSGRFCGIIHSPTELPSTGMLAGDFYIMVPS